MGPADIVPPEPVLPSLEAWNFEQELGEPDLVIASIPIDIPAGGNDLWHKHYVDTGLTEKRCIKAMQVKPRGDTRAVVHHSNPSLDVMNPETGEYERFSQLTEYAMGKWGELMPEGVCREILETLVSIGISTCTQAELGLQRRVKPSKITSWKWVFGSMMRSSRWPQALTGRT